MNQDFDSNRYLQSLLDLGMSPVEAKDIVNKTIRSSIDAGDSATIKNGKSIQKTVLETNQNSENFKESNNSECIQFINTTFMLCNLPKKKPEGSFFQRVNGYRTFRLISQPDIGLPYGKWARLLLIYISTEVKLKKSKHIFFGTSLRDLIRILMSDESSKNMNSAERNAVLDQLKRLLTTTFSIIENDTKSAIKKFEFQNCTLAEQGVIFYDDAGNWSTSITLTEIFYQNCINHSAPIDMNIVRSLTSSYEIDLYCWLCYRLNSIKHPTNIPWEQLFIQFSDPLAEEMLITKNSNMIQLKKQTIPSYKSSMELQKSFRNFKTHFQVKFLNIRCFANIGCLKLPN